MFGIAIANTTVLHAQAHLSMLSLNTQPKTTQLEPLLICGLPDIRSVVIFT